MPWGWGWRSKYRTSSYSSEIEYFFFVKCIFLLSRRDSGELRCPVTALINLGSSATLFSTILTIIVKPCSVNVTGMFPQRRYGLARAQIHYKRTYYIVTQSSFNCVSHVLHKARPNDLMHRWSFEGRSWTHWRGSLMERTKQCFNILTNNTSFIYVVRCILPIGIKIFIMTQMIRESKFIPSHI